MKKSLLKATLLLLVLFNVTAAGAQNEAEVSLDTTVTTAGLTPQPLAKAGTNVTVITRENINNSITQDIGQIISQAAGLDIPKQAGLGNAESLSIRGVPAQQVLILLNGCPLNSPSLGLFDLSQLTLENVERIEIVRGAASGLFGANAMGGVVNIITKAPKDKVPQTSIDVFMGSYNTKTYNFSFGAKPGDIDYLVTAGRSYADGWRKNNDLDNNSYSVHLGYDLKSLGRIKLNEQLYRSQVGLPGPSNVPIDQWDNSKEREASSPNARQEDHNNMLALEYQAPAMGDTTGKIRIFRNDFREVYRNPDYSIDDLRRTLSRGFNGQVDISKSFSLGYEYREDGLRQANNDLQREVVNEGAFYNSLFGEYNWDLTPLSVTLGARYDHHSIAGGQLSPRLNLTYMISPNWKTSFNAARGFRPPTLNDLFWPRQVESFFGTTYITQGNTKVGPERAVSYDAGTEYYLDDSLRGRLTLFAIYSTDLIQWKEDMLTMTTFRYMPQNVARAENTGAEVEIEHSLGKILKQSLTYTAMQVKGKQENEEAFVLLAFRPKQKLNYTINYQPWPTTKITVCDQWIASSFEQNGENGIKIPSSTNWDLSLDRKVLDADFFFKVNDLFNQRSASRTDGFGNFYPLPGRSYWAGVNLFFKD